MTYEQMEQFDPMDKYDIEVERGVYQGRYDSENKHKTFKKPFSPSIGYYKPFNNTSKVEYDEDGMII